MEAARPIAEVEDHGSELAATGIGELDRVLGGGLVKGSVSLLGGEPGIGKSTLVLQLAHSLAASGRRVLYVTAEESAAQVRARAERLNALHQELWLVAVSDVEAALSTIDRLEPDVVVVDSIQTVHDPNSGSAPGSMTQVRDCAQRLVEAAKLRELAMVIVGQVTKDGGLAGPKALEHVVDTVLSFEGERHQALRFLRCSKHRYGSTGELGLFEMSGAGLSDVADPSSLFLADRVGGVAGSVVVPVLEGDRPLLVEIQALVASSMLPVPRRSAQGVDSGRLGLLAAVLQQRAQTPVADVDLFVSAVGGVRVVEPAADLAILLSVASAQLNAVFPSDTVACGEVGLVGEVRRVADLERRLNEARRLGFERAIVPASTIYEPEGLDLVRIGTVREALEVLGPSRPVLRAV